MKNVKRAVAGCGCLVVALVGLAVAVGALVGPSKPLTPEETARQAAAVAAARERAQAEAAERAEAERSRVSRNVDLLTERMDAVNRMTGETVFRRAAARGNDATVTVGAAWHVLPYQTRLQGAQNLQAAWAEIASPDDPDKARVKIVDGNGNEVGGSRIWGGSAVWVQDK